VNFGELLDYLSVDPKTRSVLVYLERMTMPAVFSAACAWPPGSSR
jgi:acyl-CoA synthetase (NDP forming)